MIDAIEYTNLTGITLDESLCGDRFDTVEALAVAQLESLLGWPLNPDDWDNQYIEIGKSTDNTSCPDADSDSLAAADAVQGKTRLFTLKNGETYLAIDPALTVHSVKRVSNGVTCHTYDISEYVLKPQPGNPKVHKYVGIKYYMCGCRRLKEDVTISVDADWAYAEDTLPIDLKKLLADLITNEMDDKKDIKSESVVTHSYTKFDKKDILEVHKKTLYKYAGPNGSAFRRLV